MITFSHVSFGFFSPSLLRHSTRHNVYDTRNRFSEGLRCPKAPKNPPCEPYSSFNLGLSFFNAFSFKSAIGLRRVKHERTVFQQQRSGCFPSWLHLKTSWRCSRIFCWPWNAVLAPAKTRHLHYDEKVFRFHHRQPPPENKSLPAFLIRCRVSRRIFMVNATTH